MGCAWQDLTFKMFSEMEGLIVTFLFGAGQVAQSSENIIHSPSMMEYLVTLQNVSEPLLTFNNI